MTNLYMHEYTVIYFCKDPKTGKDCELQKETIFDETGAYTEAFYIGIPNNEKYHELNEDVYLEYFSDVIVEEKVVVERHVKKGSE